MAITKTNRLNMTGGGVPVIVRLSQYDDDFTLVFELYSTDGTFTIPSGTTAEVRGTKNDGKGYSASATLDISNKKVTVTGDQQMTAVPGKHIFELTLWKSNKELNSANFILDVEPAALDRNTIVSESKIMELLDVTDRADEIIDAAETIESSAAQIAINTQHIAIIEEEIARIGSGFPDDAKIALLNCFAHVAWIDEHGQDYYDALEAALYEDAYPRITAVFDAGLNVIYTNDDLNTLKQYLTVEYYEAEGSVAVVVPSTDYSLYGTLVEGSSVIRAAYEGLLTSFVVDGVIDYYNAPEWSLENGLLQVNVGNIVTERFPVLTTNQNATARMLVTCHRGYEDPIYDYATSEVIVPNRFPIPVPEGARSLIINAPSGYGIVCTIYQFVEGVGYSVAQPSSGVLPQKEATVKLNVSGQGYFYPPLLTCSSGASLPSFVKIKFNFDWDYEWHSSSEAIPTGMTYGTDYTPTFDNENGMRILRPQLVFNNAGQNCELEVEIKYDVTDSNLGAANPSIAVASVITEQTNNCAVIYGLGGSSSTTLYARWNDDPVQDTGIAQSDFHVLNIKLVNGTYSLKIDGVLIGSGTGRNKTEYMSPTGIKTDGTPRAYVYLKSIKYRLL